MILFQMTTGTILGRARHSVRAVFGMRASGAHGVTRPTNA